MTVPVSVINGSQTAVVSTEHTLATITEAGVYVLKADLGAMLSGDTLELRGKTKVRSGDTSREEYFLSKSGAQTQANVASDPIVVTTEVVFTLKQTAGTARAFPWNVMKL